MAHSEAEWGQAAQVGPATDVAALMTPFTHIQKSELEMPASQWVEAITIDRYGSTDINAIVCTVFE